MILGGLRPQRKDGPVRALQAALNLAVFAAAVLPGSQALGEGREFELRGIEVTLADTSTVYGYVPWNALDADEAGMSFPSAMNSRAAVWLYTHLRTVSFPDSGLRVCTKPVRRIPWDSIVRLNERPGPHDRYRNTDIPLVSESTAELLNTPPLAMASGGDASARVYWLSYNPKVTAQDLELFNENPGITWMEWYDLLERCRVIKLKFALE